MADDTQALIERGDSAWERRAEGQREGRAQGEQIGQAIAAYEAAMALEPDNLEPRWKLMRALFFLGEHVVSERETQVAVFERGRQLGEEGIEQIAAPLGGRDRMFAMAGLELRNAVPDTAEAAEVLFWSAAQTGLWGRARGKLASARQGVAAKIRDYASVSIALDPTIENGGGHRILGRLHTEAPKIPFVTGWIDRSVAISELEACSRISPHDLTTQLYLAEALIEFDPRRRQEGIAMLRSVVASATNPEWVIEEMKAQADARALLAPLGE